MRAVDTDILAKLATTGLDVFDGLMLPAGTTVVTYDLPYAVYYSSGGDYHNPRLSGHSGRSSVFFSVTYVGETREQAKWAGEKIRAALYRKRVEVAGVRSWLISLEESQRVRRDDDAIRPDGKPLFYGVDNFAVSVSLNEEGALG